MEVFIVSENQKQDKNLEQNKKEEPMSFIAKVIVIGLCGGLIWSLLGYLAYTFSFTELSPNLVLEPWALGDWKNDTLGNYIGIVIISLLSTLVALFYFAVLKNFKSIWAAIMFGLALWAIVFYLLNPIFPGLKSVADLERNTVITTICLYILYGVFIGYSISFESSELNEQKQKAPAPRPANE